MKKISVGFVLAAMLAVPAITSAASQVPAGFIAVSESEMTLDQAKAYCQQRGGKLPLIGGKSSHPYFDPSDPDPHIDGFGASGAPWPAGLPNGNYWIGTAYSGEFPGKAWIVFGADNKVVLGPGAWKGDTCRAACVP